MISLNRRHMLAALGALCAPAFAQSFPSQPVRIVVGNAPGGGTDVAARILAQKLAQIWGQSVIVENKPGASGVIGADLVAKARPDGTTLLLSPQTSTAIAANVNSKLPYNVLRDFTSISVVASAPTLLVVGNSLPVRSFQEFTAYAKSSAQPLSYGSGGLGSTQHLAGEMLNLALGTKMTHIPYKGENPAIADLINGVLPAMFMTVSTAMPHIKAGNIRALAIASPARSAAVPEVPTIAESGIPGFEMAPWYGLLGPANLPPDVVRRIHADTVKVLAMPDVRDQFARLGFDLVGNTPEQATAYMRTEIDKYERLVKAANLKLE